MPVYSASITAWVLQGLILPREPLRVCRRRPQRTDNVHMTWVALVMVSSLLLAGCFSIPGHPDDPQVQAELKRQAEAIEGRHGGYLWALAKTDGKLLTRYALDTIPVFDGMAAAGRRLFLATTDGRVLCLAGR